MIDPVETQTDRSDPVPFLPTASQFLYFTCQRGAESTIKSHFCDPSSNLRLAFSQPGFVTLKTDLPTPAWSRTRLSHPLVRCSGVALKSLSGENAREMVRQIVEQVGPSAESQSDSDAPAATDQSTPPTWQELHVVERDSALPGASHFEPGRSALAAEIAAEFKKQLLAQGDWRSDHVLANIRRGTEAELKGTEAQLGSDEQKASSAGQPVSERASSQPRRILEVIIMQPNRWWITSRVATTPFDLCVGGVPAIPTQDGIVSRAYLKVADALQWSGITITEKSRCVEIGSSPGGSCQRLLELGASVTGIDPADMDELVLAHPRFRHWKSRSQHIKRKRFTEFDYLFCDANVAPEYTLKNVEEIVCYPECNFQAVALTIKLSNYGQSSEIPEHIERVKSWGFKHVAARQLAHSRREYCLVGQR